MATLNYSTITILSIIFSISKACNYVGDAKMIDQDTGMETDSNRNPVPTNVCRTQNEDGQVGSETSEMFVCAPWGEPFFFKFDTADCTGSTPNISAVISGDYECNSDSPCNVFKVRTSEKNENNCAKLPGGKYHEFVTLADRCWVEVRKDYYNNSDNYNVSFRSSFASCDGEQLNYDEYQGIACDGDAEFTIDTHNGGCPEVPNGDGPPQAQYIELIECGEVTPPSNLPSCSKVVGGKYLREEPHGDHSHWRNDTLNNVPMGFDICTNEFRDGVYSSQMVWCSETLERGFVGVWRNRTTPANCDGRPDNVYQIEESEEFACNEAAGPCDHMYFRISDFEDKTGNGPCAFGNDWKEMRITTGECFYMDGDNGMGGISDCSIDNTGGTADLNLKLYPDLATCQANTGTPQDITFDNNACYSFDGDTFGQPQSGAGNWSFFQALECKGTLINDNDIRPDCNFVESARWMDPREECCDNCNCGDNYRGGGALTLPIGLCESSESTDESKSESKMFYCTPWDTIRVAFWDDVECSGELLFEADVMATDHQCGKANNCPIIQVEVNKIHMDDINYCNDNLTNYDEKNMVQGCTDGEVDGGGYGSTDVACDYATGQLNYTIYGAPGCVGDYVGKVSAFSGECAFFGSDPSYVDLLACGALTPSDRTECSYIINPARNDSGQIDVRDGAFALTTDICTVSYDGTWSEAEMYWCDADAQLAWYARWNNSRGCSGPPTNVWRIWSAVDDWRCSSNDKTDCPYVIVSTSGSNGDVCQPSDKIEQSARILDKCWPSAEDNPDQGSWKVDCNGDTAEVFLYPANVNDCTGDVDKSVSIYENGCSEFDEGEGEMWFQVHECSEPADPTPFPTKAPTAACYASDTLILENGWFDDIAKGVCEYCICEEDTVANVYRKACDRLVNRVTNGAVPVPIQDMFMEFCGFETKCEFSAVQPKDADNIQCYCDGFKCPDPGAGEGNMLKIFVSVVLVLCVVFIY